MLARILSLIPQIAPPTPDAEVEVGESEAEGDNSGLLFQ